MSYNKMPMPERALIAVGVIITTMPTLINDWIHVPDFFRGALLGLGLGLEIGAMVMLRRKRKMDSVC